MANRIRDPGRETFWRQTLVAFRKCGLTVREFCRREKLHESAFYFWRRTIHERGPRRDGRTPRANRPRIDHARRPRRKPHKRPQRQPPAFVPLMLGDVRAAAGVTLELRGGRVLRVSSEFPPERLAGLILALEAEATP